MSRQRLSDSVRVLRSLSYSLRDTVGSCTVAYHLVARSRIMDGWDTKKECLFPMAPNRLKRSSIFLRNHREIQLVKHHGRRISTALFNLLAYKMDDAPSRVGIIVGKRFGNAVKRNRAKRVFRELVRRSYPELVLGRGVLVFPKRDALSQSHEILTQVWLASLVRMHLLRPVTS